MGETLMPLYLEGGPVIRQNQALEDFETPFRTYLKAKFEESLDYNITPLLREQAELARASTAPVLDPGDPTAGLPATFGEAPARLDANTARLKVKEANVRLDIPDDGIAAPALDILLARRRRQKAYEDAINRSPTGLRSVTGLGVAFLGGVLDPLNVASAFVPVVREARYSLMLAGAAGAMGRAGVRAGVGAMEGLAGMAMLEPFAYVAHQSLQDDYKALDSLINIGFGGVLGGGLHVAGGAVRDVLQPGRWGEVGAVARAAQDFARTEGRLPLDRAIDLPEIADVKAPFLARLNDPVLREELTLMRGETGWAEQGGRMIRDPMTGEVSGRTEWTPVADWWPGRPDGLSKQAVETAVDKALEGKPLSAGERRTVEYMLDVATEQRKSADFALTHEELSAEGLGRTDAFDATLVSRAAALDEAAVERLALQHETDDVAFMRGIKGILDDDAKRQPNADAEATRSGEAREPAPRGAAATVAAADAHQREAALRTAVAQSVDGRTVAVEPIFHADADLGATLRRQNAPEAIRLADAEASRQADERLANAPKSNDLKAAEADLKQAIAALKESAAGLTPEQIERLATTVPEGNLLKQADELARAAKAAALCDVG